MRFSAGFALILALAACLSAVAAPAARKKAGGDPATFKIAVQPQGVAPGGETEVSLQLLPASGIKINKYPRIKLRVMGPEGLVEATEGSIGADAPPPPDQLETNYFKAIDPVKVKLKIGAQATRGAHEIEGMLSYFYCVAASGYCAPAKVAVKIPVTVR